MGKQYLDKTGLTYLWGKLKDYFQVKLVSGTNIKTINNESVLGSGNITVSSGSSYTATSPIDITNDVISHETSGVTAGTYGGGETKYGYYIPSITVDAKGHVTSASATSTYIPNELDTGSPYYAITLRPQAWAMALRETHSSTTSSTYILSAGQTSKTITLSADSNSPYSYRTNFRVIDVDCFDTTSLSKVICDWNVTSLSSNGGSITLTVSIASAYTNDILICPIQSYAASTM